MTTHRVKIDYLPRPELAFIHERDSRFRIAVCHRRAGKTVAAVMEMILRCFQTPKTDFQAAYIGPSYRQTKKVSWKYFRKYLADVPMVKFNETELTVKLPNGALIQLLGAENYQNLRGEYYDYICCDEMASFPAPAFSEVLLPCLSDRQGHCLLIGTPDGKNVFYEMYQRALSDPNWKAFSLPASVSKILPQSELDLQKSLMAPETYAQEYECSFQASSVGSYYGALMAQTYLENRVTSVPYDPSLVTYCAFDLGIDDATAIFFIQVSRTSLHVIDYYEASGLPIGHYASVIKQRPYVIEALILPHDANNRGLGTGLTIRDQLLALKFKCIIAPRLRIMDGINAVRSLLPKMYWDANNTTKAREAIESYRAEWDEHQGMMRARPKHDQYSHCADALRTFAVGLPKSAGRMSAFELEELRGSLNPGYQTASPFPKYVENNSWDPFGGSDYNPLH